MKIINNTQPASASKSYLDTLPHCLPVIIALPETITWERILFIIILLICSAIVFYLTYRRNVILYKNRDPLVDKKFILSILEQTQENSIKYNMSLVIQEHKPVWNISGRIEAVTPVTLLLSSNFLSQEVDPMPPETLVFSKEIFNSPVLIHLKLKNDGKDYFYEFESTILDIHKSGNRISLEIATPSRLSRNQRRAFIRLEPDEGSVLALGLWRIRSKKDLPAHPSKLLAALFSYRQGKKNEIELLDISASGARISVDPVQLKEQSVTFERKEPCILLLSLLQPDSEAVLNIWVVGLIRHTLSHQRKPTLGFEFLYWADNPTSNQQLMLWQKIESTGEIPPLLSWIMRTIAIRHRKERDANFSVDALFKDNVCER